FCNFEPKAPFTFPPGNFQRSLVVVSFEMPVNASRVTDQCSLTTASQIIRRANLLHNPYDRFSLDAVRDLKANFNHMFMKICRNLLGFPKRNDNNMLVQ